MPYKSYTLLIGATVNILIVLKIPHWEIDCSNDQFCLSAAIFTMLKNIKSKIGIIIATELFSHLNFSHHATDKLCNYYDLRDCFAK